MRPDAGCQWIEQADKLGWPDGTPCKNSRLSINPEDGKPGAITGSPELAY